MRMLPVSLPRDLITKSPRVRGCRQPRLRKANGGGERGWEGLTTLPRRARTGHSLGLEYRYSRLGTSPTVIVQTPILILVTFPPECDGPT